MNNPKGTLPITAAEVAKKRLEEYLEAKLGPEGDLATWESYTWLLKQAKRHEVDNSGYASLAYQDDQETARKNLFSTRLVRGHSHA
jgi:hypothetical protein